MRGVAKSKERTAYESEVQAGDLVESGLKPSTVVFIDFVSVVNLSSMLLKKRPSPNP
jgi:hypothetical protein